MLTYLKVTFATTLCAAALLATLSIPALAQSNLRLQVLHDFGSGPGGANPASDLIQLPNGNFVGLTFGVIDYSHVPGQIYEMTPSGSVKTLYVFASDGSQGSVNNNPTNNPVMQASNGNFYGVVSHSGNRHGTGGSADGKIYELTQTGTFTLLHSFSYTDGAGPGGPLVEAFDGNLYGVAGEGGTGIAGGGVIFRMGLDGTFSVLFNFDTGDPVLGDVLESPLTLAPNGLLYGFTTQSGPNGRGTVFTFDPTTNAVTPIYAIPNQTAIENRLILGSDQRLYTLALTCTLCDNPPASLLAFGLDGSGPTSLYTFPPDQIQQDSLMQASDGNFYSATDSDAYQINPWTQTAVTIPFTPATGDTLPGSFIQAASGVLYTGIYMDYTPNEAGDVIYLKTGAPKPAPSLLGFQPTSASAGSVVTIWGSHFVGTQAVLLNGLSIPFQIAADGFLSFTVPQTASSGFITVKTGGGSVTSASPLIVQ